MSDFWPEDFWPEDFWPEGYWPDYGESGTITERIYLDSEMVERIYLDSEMVERIYLNSYLTGEQVASENKTDVFEKQYLEIEFDAGLNLSLADPAVLIRDPEGNESVKDATPVDVSAGTIQIVFAKGVLEPGRLRLQAFDKITYIPGKIATVYVNSRLYPSYAP